MSGTTQPQPSETPMHWVSGAPDGMTGPNTPSNSGVTCGEACDYADWIRKLRTDTGRKHWPITIGMDTVAITVGDNARARADFIVEAARGHKPLVAAMDPDTLEAIANELNEFKHSARADSLRIMARKQRAALALAKGRQ